MRFVIWNGTLEDAEALREAVDKYPCSLLCDQATLDRLAFVATLRARLMREEFMGGAEPSAPARPVRAACERAVPRPKRGLPDRFDLVVLAGVFLWLAVGR